MTYSVQHLAIYPIKSCQGLEVPELTVTDKGPQWDRQWMFVDENWKFITQRQHPKMALIQPRITASSLEVIINGNTEQTSLETPTDFHQVEVWGDFVQASIDTSKISEMASDFLGFKIQLVQVKDSRIADRQYSPRDVEYGFADGFPFLLIGTESLKDISAKMNQDIPWWRFRPNIVLNTDKAFAEDTFDEFQLGNVKLKSVKGCGRCVIIDVDHTKGEISKEARPLKELAKYRLNERRKVIFGQNLVHFNTGKIQVGDRLKTPH